jgi:hypothetical protein
MGYFRCRWATFDVAYRMIPPSDPASDPANPNLAFHRRVEKITDIGSGFNCRPEQIPPLATTGVENDNVRTSLFDFTSPKPASPPRPASSPQPASVNNVWPPIKSLSHHLQKSEFRLHDLHWEIMCIDCYLAPKEHPCKQ